MLKPKVGQITLMSSPLNFFRIVVFPALSRPLIQNVDTDQTLQYNEMRNNTQDEKAGLLLLLLDFLQNGEQAHLKKTLSPR
jgi:hypothetical protein